MSVVPLSYLLTALQLLVRFGHHGPQAAITVAWVTTDVDDSSISQGFYPISWPLNNTQVSTPYIIKLFSDCMSN